VPKTLLAVDDSATMRKVLEITFVGEDFTVHAAADRGGLLSKLGENPSAVVIDTTLEGDDGYAICKEVRSKLPRAAIVLMASRYTPYDQARGRDSGADDYVDKPFDTQQLIDKVKKAIGVRESSAGPATVAHAPPPPPQPVAPPPPQPQPIAAAPQQPMPRLSDAQPPAPRPPYQPQNQPPQRSGTLMFAVDGPAAPPAHGAAPAPSPAAPVVQAKPAFPAPQAPPPAPPRVATPAAMPAVTAPSAAIAAQANGLAPKLAQMGLTPAQIEGVLALSREVIEQVVWEVVPQLAETLIKEEIARLTKE
jgi:CheY-like chemotaxis protein